MKLITSLYAWVLGVCHLGGSAWAVSVIVPRYEIEDDVGASPDDLLTLPPDDTIHMDFVEQRVDHFDPSFLLTYRQRYFYTERNVRLNTTEATYAFLCVGGEGPPMSEKWLAKSKHCTGDMVELAQRLYEERANVSIYLFSLEHRYYGESYPDFSNSTTGGGGLGGTENPTKKAKANKTKKKAKKGKRELEEPGSSSTLALSNENIVYLNAHQALADLAKFVPAMMEKFQMPESTQWVTFGNHYAGMLSAWARLRYPHLISAAVSNSAPIEAKLDFAGYYDYSAKMYASPEVGGSPECLDIIRQGHEDLSSLLTQDGQEGDLLKEQVATNFSLCKPSTVFQDIGNVGMYLGSGVMFFGTQNNNPACTRDVCNVEKKCQVLLESAASGLNPVESLQVLVDRNRASRGQVGCELIDWNRYLASVADPTEGNYWRSWWWQLCTAFGFYPSCEVNSDCPLGRGWATLETFVEVCEAGFGKGLEEMSSAVQDTNLFFGGYNLGTSRVLSVKGGVASWILLAIRGDDPTNAVLPTSIVPGAGSSFWSHPSKSTDSPAVVAARELIYSTVTQWLEQN